MWRKRIKYFFLALLMVLTFVGISKASDNDLTTNSPRVVKADDLIVNPLYTPSAAPVKILGLYWTSGFTKQPADQYTYLGQSVNLTAATTITILDSISSPNPYRYQWWTTDDGTKWDSPSGATSKNITVDPQEVGISYYQLAYTRKNLIGSNRSGYYSKMASVTTYPEPKDARSVKVTTDDDYLYNNTEEQQTTYAIATPDPYDSTAKLSWSIDNEDLATIDPDSGLITANNSGKSGTVTITGTLTNSDGEHVDDTTTVRIGGGLDDQTVNEGNPAKFDILGTFDIAPDSITWHKVVNGTDTTVGTGTSFSYTTPDTVWGDNQSQYYAVIKTTQNDMNGNPQTQTITTNKATLTVIPDTFPKIELNSTIFNNTYDDHNADNTELYNVVDLDQITIKGTATDTNVNSAMKTAAFQIQIPSGVVLNQNALPDITNVKIDGQSTDDFYVGPGPTGNPQEQYVYFFDIPFDEVKTHSFEFTFTVKGNGNSQFITSPELIGTDEDENAIDGTFRGNMLTINFTNGKLNAQAKDIDYGTLKYSNVGTPVAGTIDGATSDNILNIVDNRRQKDATAIYLTQNNQFTSGANVLDSELRYYDSDGNYQEVSQSPILIDQSESGDTLNSVANDPDIGLKLLIRQGNLTDGQYTSTLTWTIANAPQ